MIRVLPLLLLAACAGGPGSTPLPALDGDRYATQVQPILEARCATLDCHGDQERALRLYAETGLRASDALRDQPITADELAANVRAIAALDPDLVLDKPLAGRLHHEGDDVWLSPDEDQPSCVRAWLAGADDGGACMRALAEVMLPP